MKNLRFILLVVILAFIMNCFQEKPLDLPRHNSYFINSKKVCEQVLFAFNLESICKLPVKPDDYLLLEEHTKYGLQPKEYVKAEVAAKALMEYFEKKWEEHQDKHKGAIAQYSWRHGRMQVFMEAWPYIQDEEALGKLFSDFEYDLSLMKLEFDHNFEY